MALVEHHVVARPDSPPLLRLPSEVRLLIWEQLLSVRHVPVTIEHPGRLTRNLAFPLLGVCKAIRSECQPILDANQFVAISLLGFRILPPGMESLVPWLHLPPSVCVPYALDVTPYTPYAGPSPSPSPRRVVSAHDLEYLFDQVLLAKAGKCGTKLRLHGSSPAPRPAALSSPVPGTEREHPSMTVCLPPASPGSEAPAWVPLCSSPARLLALGNWLYDAGFVSSAADAFKSVERMLNTTDYEFQFKHNEELSKRWIAFYNAGIFNSSIALSQVDEWGRAWRDLQYKALDQIVTRLNALGRALDVSHSETPDPALSPTYQAMQQAKQELLAYRVTSLPEYDQPVIWHR